MHYSTIVFGLLALSGVANTVPIDENHQGDVTTISVASSLQERGPTTTKATTGKTTTAAAGSSTGKATSIAASNTSGKPASTVSSAAAATSSSAGVNSKGNSTTSGSTNNSTTNGGTSSRGNSTAGGATNSTQGGNSTSCPRAREPASNDIKNKYIITYNGRDIKTLQKEIQGYKYPSGQCPKVQTSEPVFLVDKKYQIYIGHLDDLIVKGVLDPLKKKKELAYEAAAMVEADATVVQDTAGWSLARISQEQPLQNLGTNNARTKQHDWKFPHDSEWGKGVLIYIIDTGIRGTHADFGGRVEAGHTMPNGFATGSATNDAHGHGTAVASVAAGKTVGVARQATIIPVKISDSGAADSAALTQALDWVKNDLTTTRQGAKAVINVSWTMHRTVASEAIIQTLADVLGAHVFVSAGNAGVNDCANRIRNDKLVAMVGGIDWKDKSVFNYGPCVNMNAPADRVYVARHDSDSGFRYDAGTSFASPMTAGVAASELTTQNISPSQMRTLLETQRSATGITNIRDSQPDRILLTSLAKQPGNVVQ